VNSLARHSFIIAYDRLLDLSISEWGWSECNDGIDEIDSNTIWLIPQKTNGRIPRIPSPNEMTGNLATAPNHDRSAGSKSNVAHGFLIP
jgi:hypothetical protein